MQCGDDGHSPKWPEWPHRIHKTSPQKDLEFVLADPASSKEKRELAQSEIDRRAQQKKKD